MDRGEKARLSICNKCDRAYAIPGWGCSWIMHGNPVDGWDAYHVPRLSSTGEIMHSYNVRKCPLFVPDPPRKISTKDKAGALYLHDGEMLTLAEISERTGEPEEVLQTRFKNGNKASGRSAQQKFYSEKHGMLTKAELAKLAGVARSTVERRLERGMSPDEVIERGRKNVGATVFLEYNGEKHTYKEWEEIIGIPAGAIQSRVCRGWTMERIMSRPVISWSPAFLEHNGESRSLREWSQITGIPVELIRIRKSRGWSAERILTTPHTPRGRNKE